MKNNPILPSSLSVVIQTSFPSLSSAALEAINKYMYCKGIEQQIQLSSVAESKINIHLKKRLQYGSTYVGSKWSNSCGKMFLREVKMQICMAPLA